MDNELTRSGTDVLIHALRVFLQRLASSNRNEKLRDVALSILARFNGTTPATHFDSP